MTEHTWSASQPIVTHCQHGLDLRLHPRCYLCTPEPADAERARHAALVAAARDVVAAYDATMHSLADEGDYQRRDHAFDALRAALDGEPR